MVEALDSGGGSQCYVVADPIPRISVRASRQIQALILWRTRAQVLMTYLPSGYATKPTLQFNWVKVYLGHLGCRVHHLVSCLVGFSESPLFPNGVILSLSM